uniref:Uncharacterized protein n=1 Tax=Chromera velia CCMP2878 TaxID=1169474 RepID=A0A0G4FG28_9ALVE|eukprot:Cvel_16802.t1-p1 / transcript=Cvel_16802.t1 / gene=Cvel_16802 / organism=Chromera_velia_CCMP2878 / gene_product=hypothetical protein / transcript_product=hypothetical protein / location=Cvel_scaffold1312:9782-20848(-) / protein_length=1499 / sequence_SO=supercontig / SO=protein_coding / is_pseudo=false
MSVPMIASRIVEDKKKGELMKKATIDEAAHLYRKKVGQCPVRAAVSEEMTLMEESTPFCDEFAKREQCAHRCTFLLRMKYLKGQEDAQLSVMNHIRTMESRMGFPPSLCDRWMPCASAETLCPNLYPSKCRVMVKKKRGSDEGEDGRGEGNQQKEFEAWTTKCKHFRACGRQCRDFEARWAGQVLEENAENAALAEASQQCNMPRAWMGQVEKNLFCEDWQIPACNAICPFMRKNPKWRASVTQSEPCLVKGTRGEGSTEERFLSTCGSFDFCALRCLNPDLFTQFEKLSLFKIYEEGEEAARRFRDKTWDRAYAELGIGEMPKPPPPPQQNADQNESTSGAEEEGEGEGEHEDVPRKFLQQAGMETSVHKEGGAASRDQIGRHQRGSLKGISSSLKNRKKTDEDNEEEKASLRENRRTRIKEGRKLGSSVRRSQVVALQRPHGRHPTASNQESPRERKGERGGQSPALPSLSFLSKLGSFFHEASPPPLINPSHKALHNPTSPSSPPFPLTKPSKGSSDSHESSGPSGLPPRPSDTGVLSMAFNAFRVLSAAFSLFPAQSSKQNVISEKDEKTEEDGEGDQKVIQALIQERMRQEANMRSFSGAGLTGASLGLFRRVFVKEGIDMNYLKRLGITPEDCQRADVEKDPPPVARMLREEEKRAAELAREGAVTGPGGEVRPAPGEGETRSSQRSLEEPEERSDNHVSGGPRVEDEESDKRGGGSVSTGPVSEHEGSPSASLGGRKDRAPLAGEDESEERNKLLFLQDSSDKKGTSNSDDDLPDEVRAVDWTEVLDLLKKARITARELKALHATPKELLEMDVKPEQMKSFYTSLYEARTKEGKEVPETEKFNFKKMRRKQEKKKKKALEKMVAKIANDLGGGEFLPEPKDLETFASLNVSPESFKETFKKTETLVKKEHEEAAKKREEEAKRKEEAEAKRKAEEERRNTEEAQKRALEEEKAVRLTREREERDRSDRDERSGPRLDESVDESAERDETGAPVVRKSLDESAERDETSAPVVRKSLDESAERDETGAPVVRKSLDESAERDETGAPVVRKSLDESAERDETGAPVVRKSLDESADRDEMGAPVVRKSLDEIVDRDDTGRPGSERSLDESAERGKKPVTGLDDRAADLNEGMASGERNLEDESRTPIRELQVEEEAGAHRTGNAVSFLDQSRLSGKRDKSGWQKVKMFFGWGDDDHESDNSSGEEEEGEQAQDRDGERDTHSAEAEQEGGEGREGHQQQGRGDGGRLGGSGTSSRKGGREPLRTGNGEEMKALFQRTLDIATGNLLKARAFQEKETKTARDRFEAMGIEDKWGLWRLLDAAGVTPESLQSDRLLPSNLRAHNVEPSGFYKRYLTTLCWSSGIFPVESPGAFGQEGRIRKMRASGCDESCMTEDQIRASLLLPEDLKAMEIDHRTLTKTKPDTKPVIVYAERLGLTPYSSAERLKDLSDLDAKGNVPEGRKQAKCAKQDGNVSVLMCEWTKEQFVSPLSSGCV